MTPSPRARRSNTFWQIFALPLITALASLVGLVAALLGDGPLNVIAWIGLAVPVGLVCWAMACKPGRPER